jgi:isoquinoline 1-oxidoreductase beta subunit
MTPLSRRTFLWVGAATASGALTAVFVRRGAPPAPVALVPLVTLDAEGLATVVIARTEMGQGTLTALAMLVAEELEIDWARVRVDNELFDVRFGDQLTTGSTSMNELWDVYRSAGALARELLRAAAAELWQVPLSDCHCQRGMVQHPATGRTVPYEALLERAARVKPPPDARPKDAASYRYLGRPIGRLDTPPKVDGSARFGLDARVPGMLIALVERAPRFGAKLKRFDGRKALQVKGVRHVVPIDSGVAVVAEHTWAAKTGREALVVEWDEGGAGLESAGVSARLSRALGEPCDPILVVGDVDARLKGTSRSIEASYEFPFLAHATMEPVNATAHVEPHRCTIWAPTQAPRWNRRIAARLTGLPEEAIEVHRLYAGGGFGRKSQQDFVIDAVQVAKTVGCPVKVVSSREDDLRHDFYRPAFAHRVRGSIDAEGRISAWDHRLVGPSVRAWWHPFNKSPGLVDDISTAGAAPLPYEIPNFRAETKIVELGVPVGIWRSIGTSYTTFVNETFIDELAQLSRQDPVEFRLRHLEKAPRSRAVLELAAERSGWRSPRRDRRFLGVALFVDSLASPDEPPYDVHVAQVAEVELLPDGSARVQRVVCAIDCGFVINPRIVAAQVEGGIVFGLSAALHGAITLADGAVQQANFNDYPVLRMSEVPRVETHLVASTARPGGVGEKAVSVIAPAVANALFAATGVRARRLPLKDR